MPAQLTPDLRELIVEFQKSGVEFVLVGGYAVGAHGYVRATGDIDLLVKISKGNAQRVFRALAAFGAPLDDMSVQDFLSPSTVFHFGEKPNQVDILTSISGVSFAEIWNKKEKVTLEGLSLWLIGMEQLIKNKLAAGRGKDKEDVKNLRKIQAQNSQKPRVGGRKK